MNLEDRIKRRYFTEYDFVQVHRADGSSEPLPLLHLDDAARIAALEAEDTANPIAATAVVRRDARVTTGPDLNAFASAFATALQQHDEEYL